MTKYLTGSKRLQVIQRWLQGHDDPEYDVLPTKKEGKYIVKKRKEPLKVKNEDSSINSNNNEESKLCLAEALCAETEETEETLIQNNQSEENSENEKPVETPKKVVKQTKKSQKQVKPKKIEVQTNNPTFEDPTINLEILNQLKLLGDEIKAKREKKEQKRMIKEVVQK